MRNPVLLMILAVFGLVGIPGCVDKEVHNRSGDLLMANKAYEQAINYYRRTIAEFPNSKASAKAKEKMMQAYREWGEERYRLWRYDEAVNVFARCLSEFQDHPALPEIQNRLEDSFVKGIEKYLSQGELPSAGAMARDFYKYNKSEAAARKVEELKKHIGIIAFSSAGKIYIVNGDGTMIAQVIDGIHPALSFNGTMIAFIEPVPGRNIGVLHICDLDGNNKKMVLKAPISFLPHWFPDNKNIIVNKGEKFSFAELFQVVDIEGESKRTQYNIGFELKAGEKAFDYIADIDSAGDAIIACTSAQRKVDHRICKVSANFDSFGEVLNLKQEKIFSVSLNPEDNQIAFSSEKGIFVAGLKGQSPLNLIDADKSSLEIRALSYSPFGANIIFIAKDKNQKDSLFKLYITNLKGEFHPFQLEGIDDSLDPDTVSWELGYIHQLRSLCPPEGKKEQDNQNPQN